MKLYFVALILPEGLNEMVQSYKLRMKEKYGCRVALNSPAHITFVPPFRMLESNEPSVIQIINEVSREINSFWVHTNDFGSFPPRTIFIGVRENKELSTAKELVNAYLAKPNCDVIKMDSRPFHPHITIANRDLQKDDYAQAWQMFAQSIFQQQWMAQGLSLLRHNKKNWDVVYTSQFNMQ